MKIAYMRTHLLRPTQIFKAKLKELNSLLQNTIILMKPLLEFIHNILTKVEVMPAQAPAASLPMTESSPFFALKSFYKSQN